MNVKYIDWLNSAWASPEEAIKNFSPNNGLILPHFRLIKSLANGNVSALDFASLLRAVIRFEAINSPGEFITLNIPNSVAEILSPESIKKTSLEVIKKNSNKTTLTATEWNPTWLEYNEKEPPESMALNDMPRRNDSSVPGDPFLQHIGLECYRSAAQREAVRSVFCAPPGHSLAINLPTGSGKSLCAFLPSILPTSIENDQLGVTPIVVPTVSLALDMAQKLEPFIGHSVAYRPENKEEALEIQIRCKQGIQGPVLVSPESLVGSLSSSILKAASRSFLRYFVVDEAHMILSWGDEFRPAFQQMASLRKKLLTLSKDNQFITLLLSATFTEYHLRWLKIMFSEEENFSIIHASRLRPEPTFWQVKATSDAQRRELVCDALYKLPKPLILYTVQRSSAMNWYNDLIRAGFSRVGLIHGRSNNRDEQIKGWNNEKIDIMVATSAFGLGVDKPNIRGVIHAELPETVDRFYQDVGRGGRDGFGCISILFWIETDRYIIQKLQNPSFIGSERGINRWKKMFNNKEIIDPQNHIYRISLNTPAEIDMQGELNERWNLRTLLLLERAGIISLEVGDKSDRYSINVRVLQKGHTERKTWDDKVENLRNELKSEYKKSTHLLERMLSPATCLSKVFARCYNSDLFNISVVTACGGCPVCRKKNEYFKPGKLIARKFPNILFAPYSFSERFLCLADNKTIVSVYYPEQEIMNDQFIDRMSSFAQWFLDHDKINIVAYPSLSGKLSEMTRINPHWKYFLNDIPPNGATKLFPTLVFLKDPFPQWWSNYWIKLKNVTTKNILVLPQNTRAPDHHGRFVRDIIGGIKIDFKRWEDEYLE